MAEYEGAGLSRDEALARSITDVSTELGTTEQNLLDRIADSDLAIREEFKDEIANLQASLAGDVANLEANLLEKIAGYEAAGLSRDEALSQSVADLSAELGTTEQNLLDRIAGSELAIREDFGAELADLRTSLSGEVADLETNVLDKMAEYEAAGLSRDEALARAIEDVSGDVDATTRTLLTKIDEAEQAGADRDTALRTSISDLASELGVTEETLLARIGESEESLRAAIGETEADLLRAISGTEGALTAEIEAVAELVGKPASEVTDADIDFVADLIAQQEAINDPATYTQEQLAYDVTGDGVVDQADLDLLQQARTGQDVLFDLDSMFAPTGLYAAQQQTQQALQRQMELQQQQEMQQQQAIQQQQAMQQQAMQAQIAQQAQEARRRDLFGQIMGAADITGQQVTVEQSPLAQIDYLYDGPQQRASMFPTPYGTIERGSAQPTTRPRLPFGRKRGGIIDANDELLRIIGGS
jgi:hypothetical protein